MSLMDFSLCSSALGDGPVKVTSRSTFAQAEKLAIYRRRRAPHGFQGLSRGSGGPFLHFCRCGPIESAVSLENKLPNSLICLRQRLLIRQEYDAEVPGSGLLAKAGAVYHKYMLFQAKFLDENIVGFGDIESRESVERATRRNTAEMRGGVRPLHGEITAGAGPCARPPSTT